jgi:very-short-patch-repair endonuclease
MKKNSKKQRGTIQTLPLEGGGKRVGVRLRTIARGLRKRPTDTESYLWRYLRNRQLSGSKFRRQQPIGPYIVDFVNFEMKVVIEVDGGQHAIHSAKDTVRDQFLRRQGYNVLRFWDNEVLVNIEGVLEQIRETLTPHPGPLPQRGEGIIIG